MFFELGDLGHTLLGQKTKWKQSRELLLLLEWWLVVIAFEAVETRGRAEKVCLSNFHHLFDFVRPLQVSQGIVCMV